MVRTFMIEATYQSHFLKPRKASCGMSFSAGINTAFNTVVAWSAPIQSDSCSTTGLVDKFEVVDMEPRRIVRLFSRWLQSPFYTIFFHPVKIATIRTFPDCARFSVRLAKIQPTIAPIPSTIEFQTRDPSLRYYQAHRNSPLLRYYISILVLLLHLVREGVTSVIFVPVRALANYEVRDTRSIKYDLNRTDEVRTST